MKKLLATSIVASMLVNPLSVLATESSARQELSVTEQLLEELTSQEVISGEITSQEPVSEYSLDDIFDLNENITKLDEILADTFEDEVQGEEFVIKEEGYSVALDATNFPSENLRNTLADYDEDEDGILSSDELRDIHYLSLSNVTSNEDLIGLELLTDLSNLNIVESEVDKLELDLDVLMSERQYRDLAIYNSKIDNITIKSEDEEANLELYIVESQLGGIELLQVSNLYLRDSYGSEINGENIKFGDQTIVSKLEASANVYESLDIKNPEELIRLSVYGDTTTDTLDLDKYTALKQLWISSSTIKTLDISKLTNLMFVSLTGTSISKLDTSKCTELLGLYLDETRVSSLDLSKNTKLFRLEVSNTNLTDLVLTKNIALEHLNFNNTNISSIDLSKNVLLSQLGAINTRVKTFDLSNNKQMDYVAVASAYLEDVIIAEDNTGSAAKVDAGIIGLGFFSQTLRLTTSLLTKNDKLVLPETVTQISYNSFIGNNVPLVLEVPETVKEIIAYDGPLVKNSNSLHTLVLPDLEVCENEASGLPVENCVNLSNVYYRGDAPVSEEYNYETGEIIGYAVYEDYFKDLTLNVYYPKGNDTWNDVVGNNYGGKITWIEWDGTSEGDLNVDFVAPYIPESATLDVEAEVKDEVAYATVDDDKLRDIILAAVEASLDGANVQVAVKTDGIYKSVELILEEASIGDLTGQNVQIFSILSEIVNMTFDYNALLAIKNATSGAVTFKATWVDVSTLSAQAKALFGDRPVMDFVVVDENGTQVEDFQNGTVKIAIPYTLQKGEVGSDLSVYYVNPRGTLDKMSTQYNVTDKNVTFSTNHFSTYGVGNDNASNGNVSNGNAGNDLSDTPKTGDNTTIWVLIFMLCSSMVGMIVLLKRSRNELPIE